MSNRESLRNWAIVLVLLLLASSAALLPTISEQFAGPSTRVPAEPQTVEVGLLSFLNGGEPLTLTAFQALGVLFAIVVATVIPAGLVLAFLYTLLSRQVTKVAESEEFQANLAALNERGNAKLQQMNDERSVAPTPEHKMPRWSVISTSIIILLFVILFGMLINGTFVPEGEYFIGDQLVNSVLPIVGGLSVVTLLLLIWRMRVKSLEKLEASDDQPIPWDFLWVLMSGLLVVGLGLALMVYLNIPA